MSDAQESVGRPAENGTTREDLVLKAWASVLQMVNKVLEADKHFGFGLIENNIKPSFEQIVNSLVVMDAILNTMLATKELQHDETRQAYNAKQCVWHIQLMVTALRDKDVGAYDKAVDALKKQAQF
jgi:hypothetical protein